MRRSCPRFFWCIFALSTVSILTYADYTPAEKEKTNASPGEWHSVTKRYLERLRPDGTKETLEASGTQEDWPYTPFKTVKAYLYDTSQGGIETLEEREPVTDPFAPQQPTQKADAKPAKREMVVVIHDLQKSIFPNDDEKLHPGVINPEGAELTPAQIQTLLTAITGRHTSNPHDCYQPHHAFVFYDSHDRPVAWIDVCFSCQRQRSWPTALPGDLGYIDYPALLQLMKEMRVPVADSESPRDFYNKLFEEHRAKHPHDEAAKPKAGS